jgi:SAM-dependent methyltransferase
MGLGKVVNSVLNPLGLKIARLPIGAKGGPTPPHYELASDTSSGLKKNTLRVLNLVEYTKRSGATYSGGAFDSAYHSIELDGHSFSGQRQPQDRLAGVDFDFNDAVVLDIGCNQGGMLFAVADRIKYGIGIDYDPRMINAANRIRSHLHITNTDFYVFDLEREHLDLLDSLLRDDHVDIIFLLSVCMWIKNWREVVNKCSSLAPNLLFETNGSPGQQTEQEQYLRKIYRGVKMLRGTSPDDPSQQKRKLFLCDR